jgi:hypothetical protein
MNKYGYIVAFIFVVSVTPTLFYGLENGWFDIRSERIECSRWARGKDGLSYCESCIKIKSDVNDKEPRQFSCPNFGEEKKGIDHGGVK